MTSDLEPLFKRLSLANGRRTWRSLVERAEKEEWMYEQLLVTLLEEEISHRRTTRLGSALHAARFSALPDHRGVRLQLSFDVLVTLGSLLSP